MDRRHFLAGATAGCVAAVAGCLSDDSSGGGNREVTDLAGRTVSVPDEPASVAAVNAGSLRLLAQFEATDLVVGVENDETTWRQEIPYNAANPDLANETVVGGQGGEPETLIAEDPDVILSTGGSEELETLQERTSIPTVGLSTGQLMDIGEPLLSEVWELLGEVLAREERASQLQSFLDETTADLTERVENAEQAETPPTYVTGVSFQGGQGFEATRPRFAPFDLLGGVDNVAADVGFDDIPHVTVSAESIIDWDPAFVFVDRANIDLVVNDIEQNTAYQNLTAIENGNVYGLLPNAQYGLNHSNALANAYAVGSVLYPDAFDDVSPGSRADDIYEALFGTQLYDEIAAIQGGFGQVELD